MVPNDTTLNFYKGLSKIYLKKSIYQLFYEKKIIDYYSLEIHTPLKNMKSYEIRNSNI